MIYCLEDDDSIRELILYTLNLSGLPARGFSAPSLFWNALHEELPELVLLDIMLPEEDGLSILKKLRANPATASLPILMTTAKGAEYDKVVGLDLGADDYLAKPFGMMELVSRIKALLRRTQRSAPPARLCCGALVLDPDEHSVLLSGVPLELTLKEYELLHFLMKNPGRAFSREQLLLAVWDSSYAGETRTVDVHIATLRQKLGEEGRRIATVRGVGYKWEAKE